MRELQSSIGESVHKLLSDQIDALGLSSFYTVEKATIYGPLRPVLGADMRPELNPDGTPKLERTVFNFEGIRHNTIKIKSYEGIDICWVEEANKVTKTSWDILIPTIRKKGSEIWISFNPELEEDETYKRFIKTPRPDAFVVFLTWRDNPWFSETEMPAEMEAMKVSDPESFENVWEGRCVVALKGAVYGAQLREALSSGRIGKVPYQPGLPVETFWDLGFSDYTTIWFRQRVGFEFHYIDYLEDRLKNISFYLKELQLKPYIYSSHWLPHDATARQLGSDMTIEERFRKTFGPGMTKIVKRHSLIDGIDAARTIFPQCYFDEEKCADGLHALRHYQFDVVEKLGTLSREPRHDWASHGADSFRYSAMGAKAPRRAGAAPPLGPDGIGHARGPSPLSRVLQTFSETLGWMS